MSEMNLITLNIIFGPLFILHNLLSLFGSFPYRCVGFPVCTCVCLMLCRVVCRVCSCCWSVRCWRAGLRAAADRAVSGRDLPGKMRGLRGACLLPYVFYCVYCLWALLCCCLTIGPRVPLLPCVLRQSQLRTVLRRHLRAAGLCSVRLLLVIRSLFVLSLLCYCACRVWPSRSPSSRSSLSTSPAYTVRCFDAFSFHFFLFIVCLLIVVRSCVQGWPLPPRRRRVPTPRRACGKCSWPPSYSSRCTSPGLCLHVRCLCLLMLHVAGSCARCVR